MDFVDGKLRRIGTDEPFKFEISEYQNINQLHYEKLGTVRVMFNDVCFHSSSCYNNIMI